MADLEDMDDDFGLKVVAEPESKKKPGPPKKPAASAAVAEPEPVPEPTAPAELKQPAQIAQVTPPKTRVGIVQRDITILWSKRVIKVRAGTEVSDDAYGPNAFERFELQGVAMLEKI